MDQAAVSLPRFSAGMIAGGKSLRMGCDKKLLEFDGVPLWRRQLRLLESLAPAEILISGPEDGPWAGHYRVVKDLLPDAGPLSGLGAIIAGASEEIVLVLAVDLPLITSDFLARILLLGNGSGVIPQVENSFEPLAALYPKACAHMVNSALHAGDFSLQKLSHALVNSGLATALKIGSPEKRLFHNVNSPSDFAALFEGKTPVGM